MVRLVWRIGLGLGWDIGCDGVSWAGLLFSLTRRIAKVRLSRSFARLALPDVYLYLSKTEHGYIDY